MKTSRLLIRPLRASDAEAIHGIHELVGHGRAHRSLEELRNLYREMEAAADEDHGWHGYILELHNGEAIGEVGICTGQPEEKQAEIGYSLHMLAMFRWDAARAIARAACPVMIPAGSRDIVATPEASRAIAASSPRPVLRVMEDANHMGFPEQAAAYDRALADVVRTCLASAEAA